MSASTSMAFYADSLRDENEALRERVRQLEKLLGSDFVAPKCFGLSFGETKVFGVLMGAKLASKEALIDILGSGDGACSYQVLICRIRKKIKHHDLQIMTTAGQGYWLPEAAKAKVRMLIEQEIA
jgi:hypothetical protein